MTVVGDSVQVKLKSGDVLIFEPYMQLLDKGINVHIRKRLAKSLKA